MLTLENSPMYKTIEKALTEGITLKTRGGGKAIIDHKVGTGFSGRVPGPKGLNSYSVIWDSNGNTIDRVLYGCDILPKQ